MYFFGEIPLKIRCANQWKSCIIKTHNEDGIVFGKTEVICGGFCGIYAVWHEGAGGGTAAGIISGYVSYASVGIG